MISAGYTVFKATPSTQGTGGAAPGKLGAVLVALAPPLMLLVLGLGLAWVSHWLLGVTAAQPDASGVTALVRVAAGLAVLQVIFAIVESFRDPALPAPVSAFWQRLIPHHLLQLVSKDATQPGAPKGRWVYLFSPRGWVRVVVLIVIAVLWLSLRGEFPRAIIAAVALPVSASMLASSAALGAIGATGLVTFAHRTWPIALGSARPAALLSISSGTGLVGLLGGQAAAGADSIHLIAPLWIALLIGFVICMGWLADPNLLSLHGFYKGRSVPRLPRRVEHRPRGRGDHRRRGGRRHEPDGRLESRRRRAVSPREHHAEPGRRLRPGDVAAVRRELRDVALCLRLRPRRVPLHRRSTWAANCPWRPRSPSPVPR